MHHDTQQPLLPASEPITTPTNTLAPTPTPPLADLDELIYQVCSSLSEDDLCLASDDMYLQQLHTETAALPCIKIRELEQ